MKKLLSILLITLFAFILKAGDFNDPGLIKGKNFFPIQIDAGLVNNCRLVDESTNTIVSLGLFLVQQKSSIISCGTIVSALQNNYGLQFSPFIGVATDNNYGISLGWENYAKKCYGLQIGVFNHHFEGEEVKKEKERLQICGINICDTIFIGLANFTSKFQIGLFNLGRAKFQIGLLNFNPTSYVPFFPIFNFDMGRIVTRPNIEDLKEVKEVKAK